MIVYILRCPNGAPRLYGSLSEAQSKCGKRLKWNKTGRNGWYAVSRKHNRFYINAVVSQCPDCTGNWQSITCAENSEFNVGVDGGPRYKITVTGRGIWVQPSE